MEKQLEKLDRFIASVDRDIETRIQKRLSDARAEGEEILRSSEDAVLAESFDRLQAEVKRIEAEHRRALAQNEQRYRRELLSYRESLVNEMFGSVRTRLELFTQSEEYPEYLCSLLRGERLRDDAVIYLSEQDMVHRQALQPLVSGCEILADETIRLGGLSILHAESKLLIDKTLDTAFEEHRKTFCNTHALKL